MRPLHGLSILSLIGYWTSFGSWTYWILKDMENILGGYIGSLRSSPNANDQSSCQSNGHCAKLHLSIGFRQHQEIHGRRRFQGKFNFMYSARTWHLNALLNQIQRGWTTWMTAAVDSRVVAAVPIVMDLVNINRVRINESDTIMRFGLNCVSLVN